MDGERPRGRSSIIEVEEEFDSEDERKRSKSPNPPSDQVDRDAIVKELLEQWTTVYDSSDTEDGVQRDGQEQCQELDKDGEVRTEGENLFH